MPHPQLPALHAALDQTERIAHALAARAGHTHWMQRPSPTRWSPSECVQHLIASIDAFVPLVDEALRHAEKPAAPSAGPFDPDLLGRLLLWAIEPPYRLRVKTAAPFVPAAARTAGTDLADLVSRHAMWHARMRQANGYPLDRIRIPSPFVKRAGYSLYTTFCIVPCHERRHLWQAERALDQLEAHGNGDTPR